MESNENISLTDKQLKAIPFLIGSKTYQEGCKKARIAPKTYYKWLKNPTFKNELKQQRDNLIEDALEILKGHITKAVETLGELLISTDSDSLKRLLAKDILNYVLKARELEDMDKRLTALEELIKYRRN